MTTICPNCNAELRGTEKYCTNCGMQLPWPADVQTAQPREGEASLLDEETGELNPEEMPDYFPSQSPQYQSSSQLLSEKQFYDQWVSKKIKNWGTAAGVIAVLKGAISLPLFVLGNALSIIDFAFCVTMGVLILTTRKWGLVLAVTIYVGGVSIINLLVSGTVSGIPALIICIFATGHLKTANDAYRTYCQSRVLPQKVVE